MLQTLPQRVSTYPVPADATIFIVRVFCQGTRCFVGPGTWHNAPPRPGALFHGSGNCCRCFAFEEKLLHINERKVEPREAQDGGGGERETQWGLSRKVKGNVE
jgi:hypothetical protein